MSGKIYQVIFEVERETKDHPEGELFDEIHYVESPDFITVAKDAYEESIAYEKELKSIKYILNVVKKLKKEEDD